MVWFIIFVIILVVLNIAGVILILNKQLAECKESIDCKEGHECIDGECMENNCETDIDCYDWEICINHQCKIPECKKDDDCEEDYQCSNNRCKAKPYDGCINDEDCEDPDLKCLNKECVEIECSPEKQCEYRDDWCDYENSKCYEPNCGGGPEVAHTPEDDIQCTGLKPLLCAGDSCVCWRGLCIVPDCTSTDDCDQEGEVCDLTNYECGFFQCTKESPTCPDAFPMCLVEEGEDVGLCAHKMCDQTSDCAQYEKDGKHLACDQLSKQCIEADCGYPDIDCPYEVGCVHEQCHASEVCEDHLCVEALNCKIDGTCDGGAQCILGFCHQVKCNNTTLHCAGNHVCDPYGECLPKMCTANDVQSDECETFENKACNSLSQCVKAECGAYGNVCPAGLDCIDYTCVGITQCKTLNDCPNIEEHCISTTQGFFCHVDACNNESAQCPEGEDCIDGLCRESECHSYGAEGIAQCEAYWPGQKLVCDAANEICHDPTCGTPETATCQPGNTCPDGSSCIAGLTCNTNTYQCEAAQECTSTPCPTGSHCVQVGTAHHCHKGCSGIHPCKGGLFCNAGSECVPGSCTNDAMCKTNPPGPPSAGAELKCNLANHQCENYFCDGDTSCESHNVGIKHFVCDSTHSCVERACTVATDCGTGFYCIEGKCSTGQCTTDNDCALYTGPNNLPAGSHYCDTTSHLCEAKECGYTGHICTPTGSCGLYSNKDCEWKKFCDLDNQYSCAEGNKYMIAFDLGEPSKIKYRRHIVDKDKISKNDGFIRKDGVNWNECTQNCLNNDECRMAIEEQEAKPNFGNMNLYCYQFSKDIKYDNLNSIPFEQAACSGQGCNRVSHLYQFIKSFKK